MMSADDLSAASLSRAVLQQYSSDKTRASLILAVNRDRRERFAIQDEWLARRRVFEKTGKPTLVCRGESVHALRSLSITFAVRRNETNSIHTHKLGNWSHAHRNA